MVIDDPARITPSCRAHAAQYHYREDDRRREKVKDSGA